MSFIVTTGINDILAILLGLPTENFFDGDEGGTSRKTRYNRHHHTKGLLGHLLSYFGVVEDHVKGTIHFHLILYGSIPPRLLQKFACLEKVSAALSVVLNSMYKAKLAPATHVRHLIHQTLREHNFQLKPSHLPRLGPPSMLRWTSPADNLNQQPCSLTFVRGATEHDAAKQNFHKHMFTCRKGLNGKFGCRLAMPKGNIDSTRPVELCELTQDDIPPIQQIATEHNQLFSSPFNNSTGVDGGTDRVDHNCDFTVKEVTTVPELIYKCRNPIVIPKRNTFIWEVERPLINCEDLCNFSNNVSLDDGEATIALHYATENPGSAIAIRQQIVTKLEAVLRGDPAYHKDSQFWIWIQEIEYHTLVCFYRNLLTKLRKANGYVVDHNPSILYCTGGHHNALLLGGTEQASSAMFYVTPYISKTKTQLSTCLAILDKVKEDVEKYPSKADDARSKPKTRLVQHFLTRALNKMNASMELSDYQVAASLLGLPIHITSDLFGFCNPHAHIAFQEYMREQDCDQQNDDALWERLNDERDFVERNEELIDDNLSDFIEDDVDGSHGCGNDDDDYDSNSDNDSDNENENDSTDNDDNNRGDDEENGEEEKVHKVQFDVHNLGAVKTYTLEGKGVNATRAVVPFAAMYSNRGKDLRLLNRFEYHALVKVEEKKVNASRSTEFCFSEKIVLAAKYAQVLRSKQQVLIIVGKEPSHPGEPPKLSRVNAFDGWQQRANKFARYYLTLYRPEIDFFSSSEHNNLSYDWTALQEFIDELQRDSSVMSKFRLGSIDRRLHSLRTRYRTKRITMDYRN